MTSAERTLTCGAWTATFDEGGGLESLTNGPSEFATGTHRRHPIVEVGGDRFEPVSASSFRRAGDALRAEYELPEASLTASIDYRLLPLLGDGAALEMVVALTPSASVGREVSVRLPARVCVGESPELFGPQKNGVGYVGSSGPLAGRFVWELAGLTRRYLGGYSVPLGLPLVSERADDMPWRLTWCTDPYFTTAFFIQTRSLQDASERELNWTYPGTVPITAPEERRVYACLHAGDEHAAIEAFYATALADVPPGAAWLHDIALVHYDYLAKAGQGWFEDIDTLAERIPPADRHRVCLCLHGWYDRLGRYSMDPGSREIEQSWTLERGHDISGQAGLELTRERVREMLRYARERGFRVTLYYGDGLIGGAGWARETFPANAILRCTGWDEGTVHSVLLNPLHEDVRRWFLDYTRAVTRAFGDDCDGFVWDETYFILQGEVGPADCPGYLDRAYMTLTREITAAIHEHRADLVFLGSDNIGVAHYCDGTGRGAVGYSLVADGCWQDSGCNPEAWPFGVFPNFRNVLWSCNWWPVGNFEASRYGAENFGTPVATTNGFAENRSLAEYPDGALDRILEVFWELARSPRKPFWLAPGDPRTPGPLGTHPIETDELAPATGG
jgi:hypothetical protein